MRVRVKVIGKSTELDPFRPQLSMPISFNNAKYEKDTVVIEIDERDLEKISKDVIERVSK